MLAETQRLALLQAMGVEVYRLRTAAAQAQVDPREPNGGVAVIGALNTVPARLRAQLPRALGIGTEHVHWCDVGAGAPGDASAYVVIGTEAARALGVQLSTMQQSTSIIAATAEAPALLRDGAARRALWQALKPVARRLRGIH
jgi:hypothetical protein